MTIRRFIIPITLSMIAATAPAMAGVVYELEVTNHQESPAKSESIETAIEGRHLKMGIAATSGGESGDMIYRGDRREMVILDHSNKSYMVIDKETIEKIGGQVSDAMSQVQEALKNVPEEQRAMVEKMMKERMPQVAEAPQRTKSTLRKTGERGDKNGYPCVEYEVLLGNRKIREIWVTDWSNVEGGTEVVEAFEDMADFFNNLLDSMPQIGGQDGAPIGDPVFEHMKELGGFPVITREFGEDGSLDGETSLRSAKRQTLDPDAFEPPSGYKRQEMPGGF